MQKPPRSPSASAIRTTPINGNGTAASIRARVRAKSAPTPPRPSSRPAPISKSHGGCSCPLWDAGKRLEPPSYGPGEPCSRFRKRPLRRGIRHARPRGGAGACASRHGGGKRLPSQGVEYVQRHLRSSLRSDAGSVAGRVAAVTSYRADR